MQTIAAIDVGSNTIRMVVGRIVYDGRVEAVENLRLPVRLGQDAFTTGIMYEGYSTPIAKRQLAVKAARQGRCLV